MKPKKNKKAREPQPPCYECNGLCCRHIALEIDAPKRKAEYDNIRWYLMHEKVTVGIDHGGEWLLEVPLECRHLKNNGCAMYNKRPDICREYPGNDDFCEFEDKTSPYKVLFTDEKAFERYMARKKKRLSRPSKPLPPLHFTHTAGPHLP